MSVEEAARFDLVMSWGDSQPSCHMCGAEMRRGMDSLKWETIASSTNIKEGYYEQWETLTVVASRGGG